MILAGDVGGTKTLLGLFRLACEGLSPVREKSFPSQEYASLSDIVDRFLAEGREKVDTAAIGVAGPVAGGRSEVVNLKWPVEARRVAARLGLSEVFLLNDLEATAWGIPELSPRKLRSLTPGLRARPGNVGVIAAGTGLGTACLVWDGARFTPSASEGGHQGWAPEGELGDGLLAFLRTKYGRVSVERVVSGPALSDIYDYLRASGLHRSGTSGVNLDAMPDRNAAISAAGVAGEDALAEATVDLFVQYYGAAAGDLALVLNAVGGMYVAGGIAPRVLPKLQDGRFVEAFRAKGRLRPFVEKIPIKVVLEPRSALLGAAACAARSTEPTQPPARRRAGR